MEKQKLIDALATETGIFRRVLQAATSFRKSIDPRHLKIAGLDPISTLSDILLFCGYSHDNIETYSATKLWMQTLLEVKRFMLAGTPYLLDSVYVRQPHDTDKSRHDLSDVTKVPSNMKRYWVDPVSANKIPRVQDLIESIKPEFLTPFQTYERAVFVDMSLGYPPPVSNIANAGLDTMTGKYSSSGRDIVIMLNILGKEAAYSAYLKDKSRTEWLSTNLGYTVTPGNNFPIWDYFFGRFPKTDYHDLSAGVTSRSLIQLSQIELTNQPSGERIMLFERAPVDESPNLTPGVFYYVDGSMSTSDGKTFDSKRLDDLSNKLVSCRKVIEQAMTMSGYKLLEGKSISYQKDVVRKEFDARQMIDKLYLVRDTYTKCLKIDDDKVKKKSDNAFTAFLSPSEITKVRIPAALCKLAMSTDIYASELRTYLFLWILNRVAAKVDGAQNHDTVSALQAKIDGIISKKQIKPSDDTLKLLASKGQIHKLTESAVPTVPEKKQTNQGGIDLSGYGLLNINVGTVASLFTSFIKIDGSETDLWKTVVDMMAEVYESSIFSNDVTAYSAMNRTAFLYVYFNTIMRIIARQTPETLSSTYTSSRIEHKYVSENMSQTLTVTTTGYVFSDVTEASLDNTYDIAVDQIVSTQLENAVTFVNQEEESIMRSLAVLMTFVEGANAETVSFSSALKRDLSEHMQRANVAYDADDALNEDTKIDMLNLSMTDEQLMLSRQVSSEYLNSLGDDVETKLRASPSFSDFPPKFVDFMPIDSFNLVSFESVSPYFRSAEFFKAEGRNKRILSVGIPPRLVRYINGARGQYGIDRVHTSIVRLKVYRKDLLHPDLVFSPKEFLFDVRRFPTRVPSNWSQRALSDDSDVNILSIPSKVHDFDGNVIVCEDYTTGYPPSVYPNGFLSEQERLEIYANHSVSFLCEEYLRWFTGSKFEETRYHHFTGVDPSLKNVETQHANMLSGFKTTLQSSPPNKTTTKYVDPVSGKAYFVPIKDSSLSVTREAANPQRKTYDLPGTPTLNEYFKEDTLLLGNESLMKRVVYPKKYDRVFSMIVDPDDYYVDLRFTPKQVADVMTGLAVLTKANTPLLTNGYKTKDRMNGEISFDEYFVTIEPIDYVEGASS